MALVATAYAWSVPLALANVLAIPHVPPDIPGTSSQVAPALWILWHAGWALIIAVYAFAPPLAPFVRRFIPVAFVGALAATLIVFAWGAYLPEFIDARERILPPFLAFAGLVFVIDAAVTIRLLTERRERRDFWLAAAVAFAALSAAGLMSSGYRFTPLFFFISRFADLASALAVLGALIEDARTIVRRTALATAERERLEEFRLTADVMPQIAWRLDAYGRNLYANARWTEYTGRERHDGRDERFFEAIHPDDVTVRNTAFAQAAIALGTFEATYRLRSADGTYRYFLSRGTPIVRRNTVAGWIGTSTDIDEQKRAELQQFDAYRREALAAERLRVLARVGQRLSQSLDVDVVLETAVHAPVPDLADFVLINIRDSSGKLTVAAAHHRDPAKDELITRLVGSSYSLPQARGGSHEVQATAKAHLTSHVTPELLAATVAPEWLDVVAALEARSSVVVPLVLGDTVHGTIIFLYSESNRTYDDGDVELLEEVGRRVMISLDIAERYAREHRVADRLQRAALPSSLPDVPGASLDAVYHAGRAEALIGGDWYDAFPLDDGRIFLGVGDVMGSGLEAAVTMSAVRQALRGAAEVEPNPAKVLDAADRAMAKDQGGRIVTAFVAVVDPRSGVLHFASAGHPPPFLRRGDGTIEKLNGSGLPIGLRTEALGQALGHALNQASGEALEEASSEEHDLVTTLDDGALLVLYTDGLTEAHRDIADGEARLSAALQSDTVVTAARPADAICTAVLGPGQTSPANDDVAILTLRYTAVRQGPVEHHICNVSNPVAFRNARLSIVETLRTAGLNESDLFSAELVLGELLANVARHAPAIAEIVLDLRGEAVLSVLDSGPGPAFAADVTGEGNESGRGLFIVSKLAKDVSIRPRPGGGTNVRVVLSTDGAPPRLAPIPDR